MKLLRYDQNRNIIASHSNKPKQKVKNKNWYTKNKVKELKLRKLGQKKIQNKKKKRIKKRKQKFIKVKNHDF